MEVKIQIPDNCELIKDGDTYIVKEKKNDKPKSWAEFCKNYPMKPSEYYIENDSVVYKCCNNRIKRREVEDRNTCTSKEEAEAFLALMQLRQLRKAWVGEWKDVDENAYSIYVEKGGILEVSRFGINRVLSFPTKEMAEEFLDCFKGLCEKAKILL